MTELDEKWVADVARVIWRETYRHDTLLEFHEIKKGTHHYERTMAAARSVIRHTGADNESWIWT